MNSKVQRISDQLASDTNDDFSNLSSWMQQAFNQINGYSAVSEISRSLQGRPRYATVEDAVKDMRERSGLDKYLKTSNDRTADGKLTRSAAMGIVDSINVPEIILQNRDSDKIISFVRNRIESSKGLVKIPELQHDLAQAFSSIDAGSLEDASVVNWMNSLIKEEELNNNYDTSNYSQIGVIDTDIEENKDELFKNMK